MAQETSGTISKTILKNEMLPMLLNEQKRADRAYAYEEQAKRKAAELAAKKAAEESKFVPKFESSSGDLFGHITKANADNRIKGALDIYRDPSSPQQTKMLTAYEANRMNMDDADLDKQLTAKIYKSAEDISKNRFRKVGTDYISNWGKSQQNYATPEQFAKEALSDPNLIDFDAIGKTAKDYKTSDYTYRDKAGNQKVVKMSPLFDYKYEKDPILGTEVPVVTGVNGAEAQKLIESNSDIQDAFNVWVGNRSKEYKDNRTFIDPVTGSPTMIRPDLAEDQAAKEFMEQSFGKYGTIKYGQQFAMPKKSGGGGNSSNQFTMSISTPAGQGTHKLNVQALDSDGEGVITPTSQNQYASVGSKDDQTFVYDKEYSHPGNKKVRLLGQYDETKLSEYLEPLPDGGYLLKTGFNYSNPTKRTLYFADKDLYFGGDEKKPYVRNGVRMNWTMVKKGDELSPETALKKIADAKKTGKPSGVIEEPGYEVTANMYTGEEGETDKKRPNVPIFIPEASAGEIKKHIQAEQQKKRKKPGPETTVDDYSGEEESLVR
jgi:hypothetical protein